MVPFGVCGLGLVETAERAQYIAEVGIGRACNPA